jgi:hypothetical protein
MRYSTLAPLVVIVLALMASGCTVIGADQVKTITVDAGGCDSHGVCIYGGHANYYEQETGEVVLIPNQGIFTWLHETCHAWRGRLCPADDMSLDYWASTPEGKAFPTSPSPWSFLSQDNKLEDAANTCAQWQLDPAKLQAMSYERYQWAATWLP